MSRAPLFYEVPPGTDPAECRKCRARIYFVLTPKKKQMPVDCHAGAGCEVPTSERQGRGVPHWGTCPFAADFRKRPTTPGAA